MRTPEQEREALQELITSPGWAIYMEHMALAWGPQACEAAMRDARATVSPEEWPFESARILDTFAGMRANVTWPSERVKQLAEPPKPSGRFAALRRA